MFLLVRINSVTDFNVCVCNNNNTLYIRIRAAPECSSYIYARSQIENDQTFMLLRDGKHGQYYLLYANLYL